MSQAMILVTGAAGKTGAPVVRRLLESGFPVRALVRQLDERSRRLEAQGAEVVVGDFLELASVRRALTGVQRAYFCYPPQGDKLVEATTIFATAARDAGVEAVVNMSQITAREGARSALSRHHWLSEQVLDWADVGAIHIRPTYFTENLLMLGSESIAKEGRLYLPYGDERHAPVTAADIASVVAALLGDPGPYRGERLVLTGPQNLTLDQMVGVLSDALGKQVEYVDLPNEAWGQVLARAGLPTFLIAHLQAVADDHKDGAFNAQTDLVERIGGRPPQSLADFATQHGDLFAGAYRPPAPVC